MAPEELAQIEDAATVKILNGQEDQRQIVRLVGEYRSLERRLAAQDKKVAELLAQKGEWRSGRS
jgi:muconolactone delta-isomerase